MNSDFLYQFTVVADCIAVLFTPSAEVVIHELASDSIYYIANPVSGRKPGDTSLLGLNDNDLSSEDSLIGPYDKAGEKGQRIRSVTAILRNSKGCAEGLLCINLDFSVYEQAIDLLKNLISPASANKHPELLFQNDWRDQIKFEIRAFLQENGLTIDNLRPAQRKKLLSRLDAKGLFYAKKSIEKLAEQLGISRATAYKDLQHIRKDTHKLL